MHPCALGAHAGTALLGHREHGGGNAALRSEPAPGSVEVAVARLDDLALPRPVSFMKLDSRGSSLEALRGAREMIERDRPVIFGEFSAGWLRERGEDLPPICSRSARLATRCSRSRTAARRRGVRAPC